MTILRAQLAITLCFAALGCGNSIATSPTGSASTGSGASSSGSGGSTGSSQSTSSSSGAGAGGASPDVTGTVVDDYMGDGTESSVPVPGLGVQIQALQGGQWTTFMGTTGEDGSFSIPGVPEGPFVVSLQETPLYLYTSARVLDMGLEVGGRPSATFSTIEPTPIANDIQNLAPWSDDDTVEWFAPNTAGASYLFDGASPTAGATALTGQTTDWYPNPLVEASAGDTLHVSQLGAQPGPDGALISTVVRSASFSSVDQTDGTETTLDGTFGAVTADQSLSLDVQASAFEALIPGINPSAVDTGVGVAVQTGPGMSKLGIFSYAADVLGVYLQPGSGDVDLGSLMFGNPYPAAWGLEASVDVSATVSLTAPGATVPTTQYASVGVSAPPASLASGPIAPTLGPVQDPRVNGMSAFSPVEGATTTPTLSWSPPKLGTPSGYEVEIWALANDGGTTTSTFTATAVTAETSFPIPPGVLTSGTPYFFVITAEGTSVDLASHPFRTVPTLAYADVVTAVVTP